MTVVPNVMHPLSEVLIGQPEREGLFFLRTGWHTFTLEMLKTLIFAGLLSGTRHLKKNSHLPGHSGTTMEKLSNSQSSSSVISRSRTTARGQE